MATGGQPPQHTDPHPGGWRYRWSDARATSGPWNRHQHHAKLRADRVSLGKNAHHLVGRGISRYVIVGGLALEQEIAHTSTAQIRLKSALTQHADDVDGVLAGGGHVSVTFFK